MWFKRKGKGRKVTLEEALRDGLISVELQGVAPGVTSRVKLKVKKNVEEPLTLVIPPDTEFIPYYRVIPGQPVEAGKEGSER